MGAQSPPNMIAFLAAIATTIMAIIALALCGSLCGTWLYCLSSAFIGTSDYHGAAAVGICSGVFGMLFGGLAIAWLIISDLWDVGILRFVLVGGFALTTIFAFVSAVILAYLGGSGRANFAFSTNAAACAFQFFLMACSAFTGLFCWLARGGGTNS